VILWTIRLAGIFYVIALVKLIRNRPARAYWAIGCALYLAHVVAAFEYAYHWSHAIAVQETARQTEELFGLNWGGGIWFNYAFTAIWTVDAAWWLIASKNRATRPNWLNNTIHSYLAWMFINGAIVFPKGPTSWISAAIAAGLIILKLTVK
jgi:hypothetical protein